MKTPVDSSSPADLDPRRVVHDAVTELPGAGLTIGYPTVTYVKQKPDRTLVGFRIDDSGGEARRGHVVRYRCASDADRVETKSRTFRLAPSNLGVDLARIDSRSLMWGFPNDPRLRQARWLTEPRKIKRTFEAIVSPGVVRGRSTRSDVLSYKPQRRLVTRVGLGLDDGSSRDLVVRYTDQPVARQLLATARSVAEAGIDAPRPVACLFDGHAAVTTYVPGRPLERSIGQAPVATANAVIALVDRLQSVRLPTSRRISEITIARRRQEELGELSRSTTNATRCAALLSKAPQPTNVVRPSHGDLTPENIIGTDSGLALIDLERSSVAPGPFDLATLIACADAAAVIDPLDAQLPTFSATLVDRACELWGEAAVGWHRSTALIGIATRWHRRIEPSRNIAILIDLAASQLEAISP